MTADYPNANARLASVARSWADGEVTHEAWRKCRNGIIRDILRNKHDCPTSGGGAQASSPAPMTPPPVNRNPTAPVLPVGAAPAGQSAAEGEAARDEVLLLALVLAIALVAAILWFYLF